MLTGGTYNPYLGTGLSGCGFVKSIVHEDRSMQIKTIKADMILIYFMIIVLLSPDG